MSHSKLPRTNDLGRDPVGRLLVRLALPAITAQLVNALYNIVDRMYIGRGVGDLALTGLGVCFPVIMFVSALSALVGMGGGARAAVRMGEGKIEDANEIMGNCTALLLVISVVVTIVFQTAREPMLMLFGGSADTIGFASEYLRIYLWGTVSVQVSLGLNTFISTQGFSSVSMATVLLGAVTNIVLDPVFIFVFDMGVQGAALATIIAQTVSAVWVLIFLLGKRTKLKLQLRFIRLKGRVLFPVVAIGVSPFIMQSTESLVSIALNSSLQTYGGDLYVGAMTIGSSVMQVFIMPLTGMTQGVQPIIGFNYGAGQLDRVRQAFKLMLCASVTLSVLGWAAVQLFPGAFVALFNDNSNLDLAGAAIWALRIYMAGVLFMGVQFGCQQTFVALGQAKTSLFLALLRKIILLIPFIYIFPLFMSDKVFAVFLAEPVADVLAALTTGTIFFFRFPRILGNRAAKLEASQDDA